MDEGEDEIKSELRSRRLENVPWNKSGGGRRAGDRTSAGRCLYMRDAFYGGETAAKANKNARIVVESRKARKRRVEERKWATVALRSTQTRRRGGRGPQLPSLWMKPDMGLL